jgi:hypothetical protein
MFKEPKELKCLVYRVENFPQKPKPVTCNAPAMRFYQWRNHIVCRCEEHQPHLKNDNSEISEPYKEVSFEEAVVIWVHES